MEHSRNASPTRLYPLEQLNAIRSPTDHLSLVGSTKISPLTGGSGLGQVVFRTRLAVCMKGKIETEKNLQLSTGNKDRNISFSVVFLLVHFKSL